MKKNRETKKFGRFGFVGFLQTKNETRSDCLCPGLGGHPETRGHEDQESDQADAEGGGLGRAGRRPVGRQLGGCSQQGFR